MSIHVITKKIPRSRLKAIAKETFEVMVKAVIDVEREIAAVGGELHADGNAELLQQGSKQKDLWGINLYPYKKKNWVEYIAFINIRPAAKNNSMHIQDPKIRKRISEILKDLFE